MKKLLSLLLVALCAVIVVPLSACSKEVELTTDNYDEYITLTTSYEDINVEYISSNDYLISFIYRISTTPKGDFNFSNVKISFDWSGSVWYEANTTSVWSTEESSFLESYLSSSYPSIVVDCYGYGSLSRYYYKTSTSYKFKVESTDFTIGIYSISGTVTV